MTVEDLILYHSAPSKLSTATVYSQNAPMDHEMNDTAKKQYNLLLDPGRANYVQGLKVKRKLQIYVKILSRENTIII